MLRALFCTESGDSLLKSSRFDAAPKSANHPGAITRSKHDLFSQRDENNHAPSVKIMPTKKKRPKHQIQSINCVTAVAGFLILVVYTQRRVPDTEKENGDQEEE
jgi:hypothetical protein